jgi:hypothetical protein
MTWDGWTPGAGAARNDMAAIRSRTIQQAAQTILLTSISFDEGSSCAVVSKENVTP